MRRRFIYNYNINTHNEIWYISSDGDIVTPSAENKFGANIVSNTYSGGKGIIKFDGDVTKIGYYAFEGCTSLKSITIPNSVVTIEERVFTGCTSLTSFYGKFASIDNRCLIDNRDLVAFAPAGLTEYIIPDGITTIRNFTFYNCSGLKSITIPNSVTSIGGSAFLDCSSLTSVTIGNGVTTIGSYAFSRCTSLTSITIPNSVTKIGDNAFSRCTSLTSVYISDISAWCNISFDNSYSNPLSNGCSLYLNNELVTDLTIPDGVTTIGSYAFSRCTSLTSITIPDSVTEIGENAFYNCSSLTSVYCKAITPPTLSGSYTFTNNASGRKIYVPYQSLDAYKTAQYWSEYADDIVGYDFENDTVVGGSSLITFTVGGVEYQAEEGMTWEDWVNSSYSNDAFFIDGNGISIKETGESIFSTDGTIESKTNSIINGYGYMLLSNYFPIAM